MAIEKNAVRKGTRWMFCASEITVDEVTAEHVIYRKRAYGHSFGAPEVAILAKFLDCARDPNTAEHERLLDGLLQAQHGQPADSPMGKLLVLLRDAAVYQLDRTPPFTTPYVPYVAPPIPAVVEVEPVSKAMPAVEAEDERYAVELPRCEPLPEVENERPSRKIRTA